MPSRSAASRPVRITLLSLLLFGGVLTSPALRAQNPDLMLSQAERDSILKTYDKVFPFLGRKAIERGSPYAGYPMFPVNIVVDETGDLEARFVVRLKELYESYRLIRTIVDNLPPGDLTVRMPRKVKEGETISRVEAPRGEAFYFIKSNGGEKPERVKVRTPSLCNFTSVIVTAPGHQLADMPMILAGIDPCFSCNDR